MVRAFLLGLGLDREHLELLFLAFAFWCIRRRKGVLQLGQYKKAEGFTQCVMLWFRDREARASPNLRIRCRNKKPRHAVDR
jgi:hypothetical protein